MKAIIIITADDVNDYFLVIDAETRQEVARTDTELFGTWRWDDGYDEDKMIKEVAARYKVDDYKVIHWL